MTRLDTARTTMARSTVAPGATSPTAKQNSLPERVADPLREMVRFRGRRMHARTPAAVAEPVLRVRMTTRVTWPLIRRLRRASTDTLSAGAVDGDAAGAGAEAPPGCCAAAPPPLPGPVESPGDESASPISRVR